MPKVESINDDRFKELTTPPTDEPERAATLFPKISGKHRDFIENIVYARKHSPDWPKNAFSIPLIGTVKLHGTHNDIVIHADNTIQLQSRNVAVLSLENDPYNFTKTTLPLQPEILKLKERIYARFRERNPGIEIEERHPLIIAGEWVGPGVQKACALNQLEEKILVIISISVNGKWQPDEEYADVSNPDIGIYHVSRGGWYRCSIPNGTKEEMAAVLATLQPLADEVERECSFAKTFGKIGRGEGIVFKLTLGTLGQDARFWLKIKGPLAMGGGLKVRSVKTEPGMEQVGVAKAFAESVVREPRLEQGLEYLREMGVERNRKGVGVFLKWLNGDIEIEEKGEIEQLGIDKGLLNKQVVHIGKLWYFQRIDGVV
ncbi:hypothetical protein D0Z07_1363 [Hyphodiscus hymeniophilus]|uniref:RNA ligase domain-containing protein n=1 Tax=Hyphodiscus hymeniophilus TaxID=353542 RepID=A0A9P6VQU9_9HELO|nr:hypothetical protein D0Z07_1363 [Hyphodiscus hymeniophilus]